MNGKWLVIGLDYKLQMENDKKTIYYELKQSIVEEWLVHGLHVLLEIIIYSSGV